jgi:hypothetical protein
MEKTVSHDVQRESAVYLLAYQRVSVSVDLPVNGQGTMATAALFVRQGRDNGFSPIYVWNVQWKTEGV